MKLTELFLDELEKEAALTRRTLERVPEGRNDWKPHERSMPLGYLAAHIAGLPEWIAIAIERDELDFSTPESQRLIPKPVATAAELVRELDRCTAAARQALTDTTDEHLAQPWRFVAGGRVFTEQPRYRIIRDMVFNHLSHHRGQLTVYLRLNEIPVPSIYGPSADERSF